MYFMRPCRAIYIQASYGEGDQTGDPSDSEIEEAISHTSVITIYGVISHTPWDVIISVGLNYYIVFGFLLFSLVLYRLLGYLYDIESSINRCIS